MNHLKQLTVRFGSLVDEPANKGARVLLFKRDDAAPEAVAAEAVAKVGRKMSGSRLSAFKDALNKLTSLFSEVDAPEPASAADPNTEQSKEARMADKEDSSKVGKADEKKSDAAVEAKPIEKVDDAAMAVALQKRLEDLEKRANDAETRAKSAEDVAKAERDQRLTAVYVAKAQALAGLSVKADEFGPVLKRCAELLPAEDFKVIETVLAGASEVAKQSKLYGQIGASGSESGDSATSKLNTLAAEMVTKKEATDYSDAIAKISANPEHRALVDNYSRESRARH